MVGGDSKKVRVASRVSRDVGRNIFECRWLLLNVDGVVVEEFLQNDSQNF